ncbi:hypothetical protein VTL71DRAFT_10633, partial [Oculimacula yallundae]
MTRTMTPTTGSTKPNYSPSLDAILPIESLPCQEFEHFIIVFPVEASLRYVDSIGPLNTSKWGSRLEWGSAIFRTNTPSRH